MQPIQVTDFNYLDYIDLGLIVLVPLLVMGFITYRFIRKGRTLKSFVLTWVVFAAVISTGMAGLFSVVSFQRRQLVDYFGECSRAAAALAYELDHWKIQYGNPDTFSDYSEPVMPQDVNELPKQLPAALPESSANMSSQSAEEKLPVPTGLIVYRSENIQDSEAPKRNMWGDIAQAKGRAYFDTYPKRVCCQWNAVPGATTYRVQWGIVDAATGQVEEDNWVIVYSGSQRSVVLAAPDGPVQFRIRAETGTPEDDPTYLKLCEAFERIGEHGINISSVYSMRFKNADMAYFVVAPGGDENENGVIDPDERPSPIGEEYACSYTMRDVYENHAGAVNTVAFRDEWGVWISAFEPLWTPDGEFDGMVGVDFKAALWYDNIQKAKFYPYCFYIAVLAVFFGGLAMISRLQNSGEKLQDYAHELNITIASLTAARQEAERAAKVKSDFLANMSHEIRTPMNAILGMTHLALQTELTPKQSMYLENVESSATLLLRIINDVLDFSKIEAGKMVMEHRPFLLRNVIIGLESIVGELARRKAVTLELKCEEDIPNRLRGDSIRLQQVLVNLLTNAIKFTKEGTITLEVKSTTSPQQQEKDKRTILQFSVRDSGIGMTEAQTKSLFKPFTQADTSTTRKYGGTGLGLAICKSIVRMMNGKIWCTSKPGAGSTFIFTAQFDLALSDEMSSVIARAKTANAKEAVDENRALSQISGAKILLAEDNKINQMVAKELLEMKGFKVDVADNGHIALEMLERGEYALVLMDIQMPEMDGLEAARKIRQNPKYTGLPIIAMTAHALSGDHEISLSAGMNDHITKPINPAHLYQVLIHWIKTAQYSA